MRARFSIPSRLILGLALFVPLLAEAQPNPADVALTNAADIRRLSAAQAGQSLRVDLRGVVVTEAGPPPPGRAAVLWDGSAGIYLLGATNQFADVNRGDLIEAVGVTDPGEFAPIVKVERFQKLGSAPPPPARKVTFEDLLGGGLDAQWVEISGIVRRLETQLPKETFGHWQMDIAVGGGKISVVSNGPLAPEVAPDARVRLQATCFYRFTQRRQVLNPVLLVPAGVPVEIERPAPADPYAAPLRPVGNLLQFSAESSSGHRVHVRGIVTHQERGTEVWIRDDSGALRVQTTQRERVVPGDEIDVLGFPRYGSYIPALEESVFQKRGSGTPPAPVQLTNAAAAFDHQTDLIALDAILTRVQLLPDGWTLSLEQSGVAFQALFRSRMMPVSLPAWQPGSLVRVAGICSIIAEDSGPAFSGVWHPQSFQLLLRSPADVATIRPPAWWTARRIIVLLLLLTGGSLVVAAIVLWFARHRLRLQAQHRAMAEAEFAAILSERNRVAREIHDTLAQGLVATSLQLRLARRHSNGASAPLTHHLAAAQELVRGSLAEARNSIWNMRSQVLETGDLPTALENILKQMAEGSELKTEFRVTGRARRLAPIIENNVLRVGQEAITNATKHAHASQITVTLNFLDKQFRLSVADSGRGFDADHASKNNGCFGLIGMRERAKELQGELEVRSTPGNGTEITLTIPLPSE